MYSLEFYCIEELAFFPHSFLWVCISICMNLWMCFSLCVMFHCHHYSSSCSNCSSFGKPDLCLADSTCSFTPFQCDLWKDIKKVSRPSLLIGSSQRRTHHFLPQPVPMLTLMLHRNIFLKWIMHLWSVFALVPHLGETKNCWETRRWHVDIKKTQGWRSLHGSVVNESD